MNEPSTISMEKAYQIADELLKDRLREHDADAVEKMEEISAADVLVMKGCYDFIERVFTMAKTPYSMVDADVLASASLRPDQILFVNCPGEMNRRTLRNVRTFVEAGGFLFTTDWALKHVLEKAFPGYVTYNQRPTKDDVVRVEIRDTEDPFLKSILGPDDDPQWWLEGSSFPIQVQNTEAVKVLVTSKELAEKYGESPVFVMFDVGKGRVYHMISHFYLQRNELRTKRHSSSSSNYLNELGTDPNLMKKYAGMGSADLTTGALESAYSSSSVMRKIMYDKIKKKREQEDGQKEEKGS